MLTTAATAPAPANGYVITKVLTAAFSIDSVLVPNSGHGHHVFYIAFELTTSVLLSIFSFFRRRRRRVRFSFVFYSFIVNYRKAIYSFSATIFSPFSLLLLLLLVVFLFVHWISAWLGVDSLILYGYLPKCSWFDQYH